MRVVSVATHLTIHKKKWMSIFPQSLICRGGYGILKMVAFGYLASIHIYAHDNAVMLQIGIILAISTPFTLLKYHLIAAKLTDNVFGAIPCVSQSDRYPASIASDSLSIEYSLSTSHPSSRLQAS